MVEGMDDLGLDWVIYCWLFLCEELQVRWLDLFGEVDDALLVYVGKVEQGVTVDKALVVMCILLGKEEVEDVVLAEEVGDYLLEGWLLDFE